MEEKNAFRPKVLKLFQLVMINIIAVDSIRTLPFAAEFGLSLVFYYIVMGICFMCMIALFAAELGSAWPLTGGIYIWIREAFGNKTGLIGIWLYWIYNVFWYPTIMALVAGTLTYFFDPQLAQNPYYMAFTTIALFWIMTIFNCRGMRLSSYVSNFAAVLGVLLPMTIIIILSIVWLVSGKGIQLDLQNTSFWPNFKNVRGLAFLSTVMFGLIGLEMAAVHAKDMKNPQRDYPRALLISTILILATLILSSLGVALVTPMKSLNLITGVTNAFALFVEQFNLQILVPLFAACIVIGALGGAGAWIIGPPKGLMVASEDGLLPDTISYTNKYGVPTHMLMIQGVVVSIIALAFIFLPGVNATYWILSAITAQLATLPYMMMFAAGIRLRYKFPDKERPFKIPFGNVGIWICGSVGILACLFALIFGFFPPPQVADINIWTYEIILWGGMIIACLIPVLISSRMFKRR